MKLSKDQLTSFISQFKPEGNHTLLSYIIENGAQNEEQRRKIELKELLDKTKLNINWLNLSYLGGSILDVSKLGIDYSVKDLSTDHDANLQDSIQYVENYNEYNMLCNKCIIDLENVITFGNLTFTVADYLNSLNEHKVVGIFGFEFIDNLRIHEDNEYYISFSERYSDNEYIECEPLLCVLYQANNTVIEGKKSRISFDEILTGKFVDISIGEMNVINEQISSYDFNTKLTTEQKCNIVNFASNLTSISSSVSFIRALTKAEMLISYTECPEFKDYVNKYSKKIRIARSMY